MKKFMKCSAVIALILLLAGLVMAFIAGSVEGVSKVNELVETVTGGRLQLNLNSRDNWGLTIGENSRLTGNDSETLYDIDDNVIFEDGYEVLTGDVEKYAVGSGVDSMDIKAGGCAFYCKASDDENFYVEAEDAGKFQCYIKDGTLYVKTIHTTREWKHHDDSEIVLYIPEDYSFEAIDVNMGAGLLELTGVAAAEMNLEVGAGQIQAERIQAQNIHAKCSMGAIELKLTGTAEEFNYMVEAAMGNITIDGESYSGLAQDKIIENHAGKNMNMECSMGDIQVIFEG